MSKHPKDAAPASFVNIAFDSGRVFERALITRIIEETPAPIDRAALLEQIRQGMTRTAESKRATFEATQTPLQEDS